MNLQFTTEEKEEFLENNGFIVVDEDYEFTKSKHTVILPVIKSMREVLYHGKNPIKRMMLLEIPKEEVSRNWHVDQVFDRLMKRKLLKL